MVQLGVYRRRKTLKIKDIIFARDNFACVYCGYSARNMTESRSLSLDHIDPYSNKGNDNHGNLVTACILCNSLANNRSFTSFEAKREYILKRLEYRRIRHGYL
mgnify:CR=1